MSPTIFFINLQMVTSLQKGQFHHKGTKFTKNSLEEHKEKLCVF